MKKNNNSFQEKTQANVKLHNEEMMGHPGQNKSQTAQNDDIHHWRNIIHEQPIYYHNINIKTINGNVFENWHRLSNGDSEFFANQIDDNIIFADEVIEWQVPENGTYLKYEPLTIDDIKLFNTKDLKDIILRCQEVKSNNPITNKGIDACIIIIELAIIKEHNRFLQH